MLINSNEKRFEILNDMPSINTKYKKVNGLKFEHQGVKSIGFKQFESSSVKMNIHHVSYDPKFALVHYNEEFGLPKFDRYIKRD